MILYSDAQLGFLILSPKTSSLRSSFSQDIKLCFWQRAAEMRNVLIEICPRDSRRQAMHRAREIGKKNPLRSSENSFSTSHQVICMLLSIQVVLTGQPSRTLLCSTAIAFQPVPAALALMPQRRKKYSDKGKPQCALVEKSFLILAAEHAGLCSEVWLYLCCNTEPLDEDSGSTLDLLLGGDL